MKYATILIDPPWPERGGGKSKRGADRHYPVMTVRQDPMNWTPDRPTKPGKYWLSVHPSKRPGEQRPDVVFPAITTFILYGGGQGSYREGGSMLDIADPWFDGAQWRPYVEPPDPFAAPVPQPSEFKAYRLSDDARTPNLRLILDVEPGMVTLYEADMTSRSPDAKETEMHDKIMMSQADARWLRDTLNNADLSDPPGWDR